MTRMNRLGLDSTRILRTLPIPFTYNFPLQKPLFCLNFPRKRTFIYNFYGKKVYIGRRTSWKNTLLYFPQDKKTPENYSLKKDSPSHYYLYSWLGFLVCATTFWIFLRNFAYLSLILNFWSHQILRIIIGWITRLINQIGNRKYKQALFPYHQTWNSIM